MFSYNIFLVSGDYYSEMLFSSNYKLIIPVTLNYYQSVYRQLKNFNKFITHTILFYWVRVAFRGKGFRLRKFKKKSKLTFNFGHSHWSKIALDSRIFFFKKLKRQNYICISKTELYLKNFKLTLQTVKRLNVYTKRGLRLRRQKIHRRFGKISQVVSSLH